MRPSREGDSDDSPIDAQLAAPPVSYNEHFAAQNESVEYVEPTTFADMIQNRRIVLATLFLATGALGIPLLWMNEKFSDRERIFWAIVVTLYTILLVLGAVWICLWSYRRVFG